MDFESNDVNVFRLSGRSFIKDKTMKNIEAVYAATMMFTIAT